LAGVLSQARCSHQEVFAEDRKEKTVAEIPRERLRVLVADDDPLTLRMVSAIVESGGYQVVGVKDGREAKAVLQQDANFSAAIFDMNMPHLQGLDVILYMKASERLRRIPVGMITAEEDPKVRDDSVAAGARVFLPKPFSPPQVQMMLRMLFSKAAA
jgi:CheY-like chemotaxis protein